MWRLMKHSKLPKLSARNSVGFINGILDNLPRRTRTPSSVYNEITMNEILGELCANDASIVGGAVCDGSGESIAVAMGQGCFPHDWGIRSVNLSLLNSSSINTDSEKKNVILRQWAAEPSNIAALAKANQLSDGQIDEFASLQFKTSNLHITVTGLCEDLYLFVARDAKPLGIPESPFAAYNPAHSQRTRVIADYRQSIQLVESSASVLRDRQKL